MRSLRKNKASFGVFFTDRDCPAVDLARELLSENTPVLRFERKTFETSFIEWVKSSGVTDAVILLCGFFGILSADFLERCPFAIVNTHPSLLPAFPGLDRRVQKQAWESVPVSGFTLHLVSEELDGGAILFQQPVAIDPRWSEDESRAKVRESEQRWLPRAWSRVLASGLGKPDLALTGREVRLKHQFFETGFQEKPF